LLSNKNPYKRRKRKKPGEYRENLKLTGAERKSIDSIPVTDLLTINGDNFVFILFG